MSTSSSRSPPDGRGGPAPVHAVATGSTRASLETIMWRSRYASGVPQARDYRVRKGDVWDDGVHIDVELIALQYTLCLAGKICESDASMLSRILQHLLCGEHWHYAVEQVGRRNAGGRPRGGRHHSGCASARSSLPVCVDVTHTSSLAAFPSPMNYRSLCIWITRYAHTHTFSPPQLLARFPHTFTCRASDLSHTFNDNLFVLCFRACLVSPCAYDAARAAHFAARAAQALVRSAARMLSRQQQ